MIFNCTLRMIFICFLKYHLYIFSILVSISTYKPYYTNAEESHLRSENETYYNIESFDLLTKNITKLFAEFLNFKFSSHYYFKFKIDLYKNYKIIVASIY